MQEKEILERLELMRHLEDKPLDECKPLADDTLANVSPVAEELGLHAVQHELEDLSIRYGYPDDYREIHHLMQENEAMCQMTFKTFTLPICSMLDSIGLKYDLKFRMKGTYSIWRKMKVKGHLFDDIYDLFGARIVYEPMTLEQLRSVNVDFSHTTLPQVTDISLDAEILTCWRIYNVITSLYRPHPDRVRDWITHPKPSGYQAIQMTVMGPDCNWIEIQVRSHRMDDIAENGQAAHWKYKRETKAV